MLKLLMNELLSTMQEDKAGVLPGNSTVGSKQLVILMSELLLAAASGLSLAL